MVSRKILSIVFICTLAFFISINKISAQQFDGCKELISFGDSDSCVTELQQILNEKQICNLTVDGIFGKETYRCVKVFQENNGLAADGIVGPKTKSKLVENVSDEVEVKDDTKKIVATASKLNVRKSASKYSTKIGDIKRGTVVEILDTKVRNNVNWYKIEFDGKTGYVNGDYTNSNFIVIDIDDQTLEYYKNYTLFLSTPIVSGTHGKYDTPKGYFKINYKQTDTYLQGRNADGSKYKSHVDFWMPFNKGIGLHDASWRGNGTDLNYFGNEIYKTNGSHGCINMPYAAAKTVYENVRAGTIVVVK